jgi:hypothetical protein
MEWVALAIVVGIVIWVIYQTIRLSDENVLKAQSEFEQRLDENASLPDGIVCQQAYTYRHLMRKWFATLIAQHRYDNVMSEKLKTNWLSYLDLLERQKRLVSYRLKPPMRRNGNLMAKNPGKCANNIWRLKTVLPLRLARKQQQNWSELGQRLIVRLIAPV